MSYLLEKIEGIHYSLIQDLYKLSFNANHSVATIIEKYDTSLFGLKNIGFFAKPIGGEPAAYYGVFPIQLQYEGQTILIAQSGDTMTAPNHQKKGLFVMLASETYKLCKKTGIKLVYGFPNENSYPGFKNKLNWVFNGNMKKLTFNVFTLPLCELASKFTLIKPAYNVFVKFTLSKFITEPTADIITSINYNEVKGQILKDDNYFNYKFRNKSIFLVLIHTSTVYIT